MAESSTHGYPLSPMQQGMLYSLLLEPTSGADIEQIVMRMSESVDVDALRQAWAAAAQRHELLRTSFEWRDGPAAQQVVHASAPMEIIVHDVASLEGDHVERRLQTLLAADRERGFDPGVAPLARLVVLAGEASAIVVWTFHHLLFDGRSFPIVLADVLTAYDAVRSGTDVDLPPPVAQYREYIEWLGTLDRGDAECFWRDRLKGFAAPTPIGVDTVERPVDDPHPRFEEVRATVDAETTSRLAALAAETGVTLNTIVQAAWSLLLAAYSGEDDVVFGATRAGRYDTIDGADQVAGLFINTLPMRIGVDPAMPVVAFLRQVRAAHVELRPYEHTPLVDIQQWSEMPSGTGLFDTILMYEAYQFGPNMEAALGTGDRIQFELLEQTNYPLVLSVYGAETMLLCLEFDAGRVAVGSATRMVGHVASVLGAFVDGADSTIGALDWVPEDERRFLVDAGDGARRGTAVDDLVSRFADRVQTTPAAVAVVDGTAELTFAALDARSDAIATALTEHVGPGAIVGIFLERSPDAVASMLAVLKVGAAYLPLDPSYPLERLKHMVTDSGASAVVVDSARVEPTAASMLAELAGVGVVDVHAAPDVAEAPGPVPTGSTPAYVIYTSGSTGTPKGVVVPHRAVVNHADAVIEAFGLTPDDRVLQFAALSFDVAVEELFPTLLSGGTVVLRTPAVSTSFSHLHEFVAEHEVTVLNLPAAFWSAWVDHLGVEGVADFPPTVRLVVTGSEAVSTEQLKRWRSLVGPSVRWLNAYGPTEATVTATVFDPVDADTAPGAVAPIGRPVRNVVTRVLDPHGRPTAIGVPGELYIGGAGLALGYHDRPELTAERFVPDPSGHQGGRLYRTGDHARVLPDGNIEFLGRLDDQVKIRGFRIELGEIESALADHPAVGQAVVSLQADPFGPQLVGHIVLVPDATLDGDALRMNLKDRLPDYMVPVAVGSIDAIPLSPSGKIDRRALPPVRVEQVARVVVSPRTRLESELASIWADVLSTDDVSVHDDFFALGGNSLSAMRLLGGVERLTGRRVALADLFQDPSIAGLAGLLDPEEVPTSGTRAEPSSPPWVFPVKAEGSQPPLFHLGGASVLRNLARHLPPDRPLYALLEQDLDADHFSTSVDAIVPHCIAGLRSVQPRGPYYLAGLCFGGVVALEMARQLRAEGDDVALTLMIDSFAPGSITRRDDAAGDDPVADLSPDGRIRTGSSVRSGSFRPRRVVRKLRKRAWRRAWGPVHDLFRRTGRRLPPWLRDVEEANTIASDAYIARPFEGDVTLFIATEQDPRMDIAELNGWGPLVEGRLEVEEVVGGHLSVYDEPHVRDLAAKLTLHLDRAASAPSR